MSVNNTAVPTKNFVVLDDFSVLEVGLRVPEQRRDEEGKFAPKRQDLPGQTVSWAKSSTFKKGAKMNAVETSIDKDGFVPIPADLQEIFDADHGLLMLKVVSPQPAGYFTVPARYKGFGFNPLYDYDRVAPQRENGDFVYSIPVHNIVTTNRKLTEEEKKKGFKSSFFFFVIRLAGMEGQAAEHVKVQVDKVSVTRGANHYRVTIEPHFRHADRFGDIPVPVKKFGSFAVEKKLEDLPMREALQRYQHRLAQTQA